MTITKKFSQFQGPSPIQAGDIVVGLRIAPDGVLDNWQFTGVGSGGGGGTGVTATITQPGHDFVPGNWLRVDITTMLYVRAQSDTPEHAEVIGVVISSNIPAGTFVLQQSGYLTGASWVPALSVGVPQFLSSTSAGAMQPNDVTIDGQISRPVFIPDGTDKGWVLPYRGIVAGGGEDTGGGGSGTTTDTNITTVTQDGHPFHVGQWVRVDVPDVGLGQAKYDFAKADNLTDAQGVGLVIAPITLNTFTLQFAGYVTNGVIPTLGVYPYVDTGIIVPSTVYYISAINAGNISSINPTSAGAFSKPAYISEQATVAATATGRDTGWVLPQRPLSDTDTLPGASPYIFLGRLDSGNTWSDANIFNNNGGPFKSYFMTFNPNISNGHGLSAVGPNPITIGFQFAAGGVFFTGTTYQSTLSGVNNSAGLGVATLWGHIEDTSFPSDSAFIFPHLGSETGTRVAISEGAWTLIDNAFGQGMSILGTAYCTDWSVGNVPSNHNFTSTGLSAGRNGGGVGVFTSGIRLHFGGVGAAIFDGTQGYFTIWGIPNS